MSLYVSPTAWARMTRPAYSTLLPFPLTWTVPPALRHVAIERVEHLGLGHLAAAVDSADPSTSGTSDGGATTTSTGFLRLPARLGPGAALDPEQASAIRLQSLAGDFFAVLDGLRGERRFFLRDDDGPCSLDFLVHGYLKLMQVQTPHPFLDTVLRRSYPRLGRFVREMDTVVPLSGTGVDYLPWRTPAPTSTASILSRFTDDIAGNVPGVGDSWKRWRRGGASEDDAGDLTQVVLAVGGAFAGLTALTLWRGRPPLRAHEGGQGRPVPLRGGGRHVAGPAHSRATEERHGINTVLTSTSLLTWSLVRHYETLPRGLWEYVCWPENDKE